MSIRAGLIGTGHWAESVHAASLAAHPDIELVGVWGRNQDHRERVAARWGVRAFGSAETLLDEVELVDFAIAPAAQLPIALEAAKAGKQLLLEKPVAQTIADAVELDSTIRAARVPAVVFMTRLFDPVRGAWLKEQVGRAWTEASTVNISAALVTGPYAGSIWRRKEGAVLWDIGPHVLSQLEFVLGQVIEARVVSYDPHGVLELAFVHEHGARSRSLMTLYASPVDRRESIEFSCAGSRVISPDRPLDYLASHSRALTELVRAPRPTPTVRGVICKEGFTVPAALGSTRVLTGLQYALDEGRQDNPDEPDRGRTGP